MIGTFFCKIALAWEETPGVFRAQHGGGAMSSYQYSFSFTIPPFPDSDTLRLSYIFQDRYSEEWNSNPHTHSCAELFLDRKSVV